VKSHGSFLRSFPRRYESSSACHYSFSGKIQDYTSRKRKSGLIPLFALQKARSLSEGASQNHPMDDFWRRSISFCYHLTIYSMPSFH
jgi:hypothetical protein